MTTQKRHTRYFFPLGTLVTILTLTAACSSQEKTDARNHVFQPSPKQTLHSPISSQGRIIADQNSPIASKLQPVSEPPIPNRHLQTTKDSSLTGQLPQAVGINENELAVIEFNSKQNRNTETTATRETFNHQPLTPDGQLATTKASSQPKHNTKEGDAMLDIQPPLPRVLFYSLDEDKLNTEQQATIEQHASFLAVHPDYNIQIHGHADNRGTDDYNKKLSLARAQLVAARLLAAGVKERQIEVFGWSSDDPLLSSSQHDKNRRVELIYLNSQLAFSKPIEKPKSAEASLMD